MTSIVIDDAGDGASVQADSAGRERRYSAYEQMWLSVVWSGERGDHDGADRPSRRT
jgi:hypothetical protein